MLKLLVWVGLFLLIRLVWLMVNSMLRCCMVMLWINWL